MTKYEEILNRLSLKYNKPAYIIKDIVESQFEFTKEKMKQIDLNEVSTVEDLDKMKTSFRYLNIGSFSVNLFILNKIKRLTNGIKSTNK